MKFMSNEALYWVLLLFIFVLTMVAGLLLMRKTNSLKTSFFVSQALNFVLSAAAAYWWAGIDEAHYSRLFHIGFYGIAFFNNLLLTMFAVLSIQKKNPR